MPAARCVGSDSLGVPATVRSHNTQLSEGLLWFPQKQERQSLLGVAPMAGWDGLSEEGQGPGEGQQESPR